jgi:2-oxoglutarate dehydrogenase E1 component
MLLPHGYDGQGPEHSNARIERFLAWANDDVFSVPNDFNEIQNSEARSNMIICNLTTSANYFHALRNQIHRGFRKPLVIFSPKKLLKHPIVNSTMEDFIDQSGF